jgi:exopolysaccharide production protein ExoY
MIGYDDHTTRSARLRSAEQDVRVSRSRYHRPLYQIFKRWFDVVFSLVALIILLPLFALIALVLAANDGMPVIFRQARIGRNGKLFHIYKFRTMVKNAEEVLRSKPELWKEYQETYKIQNDPRISRVGHFLRSTTLDELPQLFNVLKGEMSIVGPRPIVEKELEKFGEHQNVYLAMKPGCAGLWQCSGRSQTTYDERVALEKEYYEKASLAFDISIIWRTLIAVVLRRGAV